MLIERHWHFVHFVCSGPGRTTIFQAMEKLGHTTPNSAIPDERGIRGDGHEADVGAESRAMQDESISVGWSCLML